jgi:hypothetical protein
MGAQADLELNWDQTEFLNVLLADSWADLEVHVIPRYYPPTSIRFHSIA